MGEVFQDEKRAALSTDAPNDSVDIHVKWRGSTYSFSLQLSTNLSELKLLIQGLTNVSPDSQKLIGLSKKAGTKLNANATLESHQPVLKNGAVNITLIGTPDAEIAELKEKVRGVSSVFNDFSHEFSPATKEWQQLQEFSQKTSIHFINEPRPGKKLLVLDLDHTLLDFSSKEDISPLEMKVYIHFYCISFLFL
jgi:ubiquitin-like domain-containing CTD phosphatase 1